MEVTLHVTYTEAYPDEAPEWKLEDRRMDESNGPNGPNGHVLWPKDVKGLSDEKLELLRQRIEAGALQALRCGV